MSVASGAPSRRSGQPSLGWTSSREGAEPTSDALAGARQARERQEREPQERFPGASPWDRSESYGCSDRVTLRALYAPLNGCNCRDFAMNLLGTCKRPRSL